MKKYACLYALGIIAVAPLMRPVLNWLYETVGSSGVQVLSWVVVGGGIVFVIPIASKRDLKILGPLLGLAGLVVMVAFGIRSPEEKIHLIEYAVPGFLVWMALSGKYRFILSLLLACGVGVLDEGFQWLLPNRVGDLRDVAFNCIGGAVGILFGIVWTRSNVQ